MAVLNHTIVAAHDHQGSAAFMAEILGLPAPVILGPFALVQASEATSLDFVETDGAVTSQHYAFLVTEAEFDNMFARIRERKLRTGPTLASMSPVPSTRGTAAEASTSRTPTVTSLRSSPAPTAAAHDHRASAPARRSHRRGLNAPTTASSERTGEPLEVPLDRALVADLVCTHVERGGRGAVRARRRRLVGHDQVLAVRERWGFSYFTVFHHSLEAATPIVTRLGVCDQTTLRSFCPALTEHERITPLRRSAARSIGTAACPSTRRCGPVACR